MRKSAQSIQLNLKCKNLFKEVGASKSPCAETYAGPRPFSEPETQALAKFVRSFDNIKMYLSFHAYGQILLFPFVS